MKTRPLNPRNPAAAGWLQQSVTGFVAALVCFVGQAAAQDFVLGSHAALAGSTVRVPVFIADASGLASAALTINFDPQILSLESVTNGDLGLVFLVEHQMDEGRVYIAAVRDEALAAGAGALVILNFRVNPGTIPGLSSALAVADRRMGSQYGRDISWSRPVTGSNGVVNVVSATLDSDGNGLPDWWEESYFGHATGTVPSADPDGDGLTTAQEFAAGTDPLDPVSGLRIESLHREESGVRVGFRTVAGRPYRIEYSDDLQTWNLLGSDVPGTGSLVEVVDPFGPAPLSRFYRLVNVR